MQNHVSIKFSIIFINYYSSDQISDSIGSIKRVFADHTYEIIIIDNCSNYSDLFNLFKNDPEIKLISNPTNSGFGAANNIGVNYSDGKYILFLNPDTIITEDFISPIIKFMEQNQTAGICGPKLTYEDGTYQNSTGISLGYLYETAEALMLINILRFIYKKYLQRKRKIKYPVEVSWLSAACFIINRELFNKVDGFNSDFFLNYEDIDLCERVRKLGYKNYYFMNVSCIHLDSKSQSRNYESFVYNRYSARLVYGKNNYSAFKRKTINYIHLIGITFRIIFTNSLYRGKECKERLTGYKRAMKLYLNEN